MELKTENLKRSMEVFRTLGYQVREPIYDPIQRVSVSFVSREGEYPIELVCDSEADGPTSKFLSKVGSGLYHICYEVDELEEIIGILREKQFLLKQKPVEAVAFVGKRIAWLYHRHIGLIELLEK